MPRSASAVRCAARRSAERPQLWLSWQPASIAFVAGGQGPYTLAIGRAGAESTRVPIGQVAPGFSAAELAALKQARTGEPLRRQSGAMHEQDVDGRPPGGATWLWLLLLGGVAVLGAMAWTLVRQLNGGQP